MKASVISIVVLSVLILGIVGNGIYINSITDDLIKEVNSLEAGENEELYQAYEHWQKHHFYICLSSPHEKTDKIEECFIVMLEKAQNNENEGFYEYKALLANYIKEIKRIQELSIDSII